MKTPFQAPFSLTSSIDPNPYGTPTSLSLIDPLTQVPCGPAHQDGIPDSPPGKSRLAHGANLKSIVDLEDDDTKSESPDLGRSLYDVPPSLAGTPAAGQASRNTQAADQAVAPHAPPVPSAAIPEVEPEISVSNETSKLTQPARIYRPQPPTVNDDFNESLLRPKQRVGNSPSANPLRSVSKSHKERYDIFDPIETDTEDAQKQQKLPSAKWSKLPPKESVQLPPSNRDNLSLTNGDVRCPSLGTGERQSGSARVHVDEQALHQLPENSRPPSEKPKVQESTTDVRFSSDPPKVAALGVSENHLDTSPFTISERAKVIEEHGNAEPRQERQRRDIPEGIIPGKVPTTLEAEHPMVQKQQSEESVRPTPTQRPKDETQRELLDRKRKREQAESLSKTKAGSERVAAIQDEQKIALDFPQVNEAKNSERQSKADEKEAKEQKRAEQQKAKEVQEKEQKRIADEKVAKGQKRVETKAKETEEKEQKRKPVEKRAKRQNAEEAPKANGKPVEQTTVKQADERLRRTQTPRRKESEAVKNGRGELALQRARESSASGRRKSSTPVNTSGGREQKPKSLTALYPGSSRSRSPSLSIELLDMPHVTPSRSTKSGEPPLLTSALRKSPSTLRRSVSSISWANPVAPPDFSMSAKPGATAPTSNGDKRTGSSAITSSRSAPIHTRGSPAETKRTSSASSLDAVEKKARDPPKKARDPPKKANANIKKQTKLNVKRDVKQKGRVVDPPNPPKPVVEEALVISSDSEHTISSFYSKSDDDVQEISKPDAGPSSKQKPKSKTGSATTKKFTTANSLTVAQDPAAQRTTVEHVTPTVGSSASSQQSVATNTESKSSSRTPARYVSSTRSSSSGSNSKFNGSVVSSSLPDIAPEPSSQAQPDSKSTAVDSRRLSSKSLDSKEAKTTAAAGRRPSSQVSGASSTQQPQSTNAMSVKSAPDQQLWREARQFSEPAQTQIKSSPPVASSKLSQMSSKVQAMPVATASKYEYTMSGPRPANFRFPSLTKLKNNPPKYDPKEHLKHASFMSSQKRDDAKTTASSQINGVSNGVSHDDESSSESDDESSSSSSNNGDKVTGNASSSLMGGQVSKKSDGKAAKAYSSLFKRMFFASSPL